MIHIIGDIHGCYYTLISLIDRVRQSDENANLIFVGDYIDRGLHSKKVIDLMIELQAGGAVCLRGNHDDVVDHMLNNHNYSHVRDYVASPPTKQKVVKWFLTQGFDTTLRSYGIELIPAPSPSPYGTYEAYDIDAIIAQFYKIPKAHQDFLYDLRLYWENETHFVCHGYMNPHRPLPRDLKFMPSEAADCTLWSRFEPGSMGGVNPMIDPQWGKVGVFGHTPTRIYGSNEPIKHGKIRLIDTGACHGEGLCALNISDDSFILQPTDPRDYDH